MNMAIDLTFLGLTVLLAVAVAVSAYDYYKEKKNGSQR